MFHQQAAVIAHAQAAAANHQKHIDDINRATMIQRLQAANAAAASAAAARPGMPMGMVSYGNVCDFLLHILGVLLAYVLTVMV